MIYNNSSNPAGFAASNTRRTAQLADSGENRAYLFLVNSVLLCPSTSDTAIQANIAIMRAFVLMRQIVIGHEELRRRIEELEISTDAQFSEIYRILTDVMSKSLPNKEKRRIGF